MKLARQFRVSMDHEGINEVVIAGVVNLEAMDLNEYCIILGQHPNTRVFSVRLKGEKTFVVEVDP